MIDTDQPLTGAGFGEPYIREKRKIYAYDPDEAQSYNPYTCLFDVALAYNLYLMNLMKG